MTNFPRIAVDHAHDGGIPCVRHVRVPAARELRLLAGGAKEDAILSNYFDLEPEDIRERLRFATALVMGRAPLQIRLKTPHR